jgi:hypothetical protein
LPDKSFGYILLFPGAKLRQKCAKPMVEDNTTIGATTLGELRDGEAIHRR